MAPVERYRRSIAVLLCLTCLSATAADTRRRATTTQVNEWTKYCGTLSMTGVSAGERVLSTESVPRIQLLWSRQLKGTIASAPSVARGKVYIGDWGGIEWALDAETGEVIASANLRQTSAERCKPPLAGITS